MDFDTQPTPGGGVPGDYPGKTKPSRPFIGDIPGEGSEGPTDIPNKDDFVDCPTCGVSHPRKQDDSGADHNNTWWTISSPSEKAYKYRGEQQGRGGHFDAGHQKSNSIEDTPNEFTGNDYPGRGKY